MDNVRGEESRKGQPYNNAAGNRDRAQPPAGFEGMNYEQKRRPYRDLKVANSDGNEDISSEDLGRRRDNR
jgi:hypothetical protein